MLMYADINNFHGSQFYVRIEQWWDGTELEFFEFMRTIYPHLVCTGVVNSFYIPPDDNKLQHAIALDFAGIDDYPCLF